MSTVSLEGQANARHFYSLEKFTQSQELKLLIEQSDSGLKVAVVEGSKAPFQLEGYMIRGLPKIGEVPRSFFDNAFATVNRCCNPPGYSATFSVVGVGGWKPQQLAFTPQGYNTLHFSRWDRSNLNLLSGKQGLYAFISQASNVGKYSYIGESSDLGTRLAGHEKLMNNDYIYVHVLPSTTPTNLREKFEEEMIQKRCPTRNVQHTGMC